MPNPTELRQNFNDAIDEFGISCTVTNYPLQTFPTGGYDDEQLPSASGTTTSGGCIILPLNPNDQPFIQQGLVNWNDSKIYLAGSIPVSGNSVITVGNTGSLYSVLPQGIKRYDISGTTIYQTIYARHLFSGQHPGVT